MENGINYPIENEISFSKEIYKKICDDIADCLKGIDENNSEYINSLLEVMEADCSFVPSSTSKTKSQIFHYTTIAKSPRQSAAVL